VYSNKVQMACGHLHSVIHSFIQLWWCCSCNSWLW